MNQAEMLSELQEVLNDTSSGMAWSETTLLGYLSEGQDKFCEQTGYFTDSTNFTLTLQTGVAVYQIPDRVIQVLNIWDGTRQLGKVLNESPAREDQWPADYGTDATGLPTMWETDYQTGSIKLYPTPTGVENGRILTLQVWRYSRYDLAGTGAVPEGGGAAPPASPEIPSRFQRACIEWAAYKAFMHHDMETQDPVKAKDHLVAFQGYVADGRQSLIRYHNQETRVGTAPAYRT